MSDTSTVEFEVHFKRVKHGQKVLRAGKPKADAAPAGVPRLARLMALAITMDEMLRSGEVGSYAELARIGHVTRARITQIMDLLNLASGLQEAVLLLPSAVRGGVNERAIRDIVKESEWSKQKQRWIALMGKEAHGGA